MGFERRVYSIFGLPPAHLNNLDILLPFCAYLLGGARFISKPLLKYRVHGQNNALSLVEARSDSLERLKTRERIFYGHLAHAVAMQQKLDGLTLTRLGRYVELGPKIEPLLNIQIIEMAKKLVGTRIELEELRAQRDEIGRARGADQNAGRKE